MSNIDVWKNRSLVPSRFLATPLSSGFFRRMDRLLEDFMNEFSEFGVRDGAMQSYEPPCDLTEGDNEYHICVDLPGMHAKDVNVEVSGNTIIISGERKSERKGERAGTQYHERRIGSFERRISLPEHVNSEKIQANFEAGVLTLNLPKSGQAQKKKINIVESAHAGEIKIEGKKEAAGEHKKSA